jgi:hypothetical protein
MAINARLMALKIKKGDFDSAFPPKKKRPRNKRKVLKK